MRRFRWLAAFLLVPLAVGCPLKRPPQTTEVTTQALPNAKISDAWHSASAAAGPVEETWLAEFNDPQLTALVDEALKYNNDLAATASRLDRAAAQVRVVGGTLYPSADILGHGAIGDDASGFNAALLQVTWELDLWGRIRYGRAAAEADYASAQADLTGARQSLAAMVAKAWFLASEARLQRQNAQTTFEAARERVGLLEKRLEVGASNEQEVALGRSDVAKYEANALELELAETQARRALEIMLGRYPAAELEASSELRSVETPVPAGLPAELLERRPDLIAARNRAAAAFYLLGEAEAARLPRISLTGSFGAVSSEFLEFKPDFSNPIYGFGANLLAPIFRGGSLKAQTEVRTAEQNEAVARYGGVVLRAFQEVEDSLNAETNLRRREQILTGMVRDTSRSVELSERQYSVGRIALLSLIQERMRLYAAESVLLRLRAERLVQRVNLHLALGGGFGPVPVPETTKGPA